MTNEAMSAIMEHLCNEARNSVHAAFGVLEFLHDVVTDSKLRETLAIGRASADQVLQCLDDVRELLSGLPPAPAVVEEFDIALCAGEVIDLLNLASGKRAKRMVLDAPPEPLALRNDRQAVTQILTRILSIAFKLAQTCEVRVKVTPGEKDSGVRLKIAARDADLAVRLTKWLNVAPEQVVLEDPGDVPFALAVIVAGKHLRALGGSAELTNDAAGHSAIALQLPSQALSVESEELPPSLEEAQSDVLSVLVAEDCDDSFALTELVLQNEQVTRARDGREALRMIQKQRFDLVLMDIHMPEMDGYTVIRQTRLWEAETGNARTPLVILSSDDQETQQRSVGHSGCSGFLRKPLKPRHMTELLDRLKQARILTA